MLDERSLSILLGAHHNMLSGVDGDQYCANNIMQARSLVWTIIHHVSFTGQAVSSIAYRALPRNRRNSRLHLS